MLFLQRTARRFDGMVNSLLITKPILLLPFTKVLCQDEEERIYVTTYKRALQWECKVVSRLWFSFKSTKPIQKCHEELLSNNLHITFPMFKRIAYDTCSSIVGPTFNRLGDMKNVLGRFVKEY